MREQNANRFTTSPANILYTNQKRPETRGKERERKKKRKRKKKKKKIKTKTEQYKKSRM